MNDILWFVVAVAVMHVAVFMACLSIRYDRWMAPVALVLSGLVASLAGLLIPLESKPLRAIAAVIGMLLVVKMYSYYRENHRLGFVDYALFLLSWIDSGLVYSPTKRRVWTNVSWSSEALRIALSILIMPLACIITKQIILSAEVFQTSWILKHILITIAFVIIMQSFGQLCLGLQHLLGRNPKPLVDNICLSRTPAEFWRRWSWPIHLWLYRYVFLPAGGLPKAVRATLLVFFVSSIMHEIIFAVAIGRVTGHQTIFFMLNALGVLASPALERLEAFGPIGELLMRLITIVFMTATAAFMFTSINYVVPLGYQKSWLMW